MPIPESATVGAQFRGELSILAKEYADIQAAARFIASLAAPIFRVATTTGEYPTMNRDVFKKQALANRAPDGSYNRITGDFGSALWNTQEFGLEYPIDDKTAAKFVRFFDSEQVATRVLTFQMLKNREQRVSAIYANSGSTNHNVTTAWSTSSTAVPLDDIQTGLNTLMDKTGAAQSDMSVIMPRADWIEFQRVTQFTNLFSSTFSRMDGLRPAIIQGSDVANMLGIKQVLVANSAKDTTNKGIAESNSPIWAAGVIYIVILADGEGAGLEEMSAARTILWDQETPGAPTIEAYREENVRQGVVRAREETDEILQGETDLFIYKLTNT